MSTPDVPTRKIDDTEMPVSGMWPAVGASQVVRSAVAGGSRAVPVVNGWLEVGDNPATNSLCIELNDAILLATTASVSHNSHAWSVWHLEGVACSADRREPLALTLRYHGVFRRGDDNLAWWSGEGTIHTPDGRRRRGQRGRFAAGEPLVVELLLAAPSRRGVSLTNVVAYMQHRINATTTAHEARNGDGVADPTFGMLQRILRAAQADLDVSSRLLPARSLPRLVEARSITPGAEIIDWTPLRAADAV